MTGGRRISVVLPVYRNRPCLPELHRRLTAVLRALTPDEAIGRLMEALDRTGGVVFARRTSRHQSHSRHLTGRLFKRLLRRLSGSRVPQGTGMFFVAARPVVDAAVASSAGIRYVPLLLDTTGAAMSAVDVPKSHRLDSPSAYTVRRRLQLAAGAIRQALAMRRARKSASRASDLLAREGRGR
jgi:hypothetical protein